MAPDLIHGLQFASLSVTIMFFVFFSLPGLGIAYAVLKLQDARAEQHDPEIGIKAALYFIYSLSILVVLTGINILVVDALEDRPNLGPNRNVEGLTEGQRIGCGLIVAGLALGLLHLILIKAATNDSRWPAARRVFVGWRFAIHGVIVLTTFTVLVVLLFQRDVRWEQIKNVLATLVVWGPSWLIHLVLLRTYSNQRTTPGNLRFVPPTLSSD
jgi:hypothetical protein